MRANNVCEECGKVHPKPPKKCMCGWIFIKAEVQQNNPFLCQFFFPNGKQCQELGSVSYRARGKDYYCSKHASELREESFKR